MFINMITIGLVILTGGGAALEQTAGSSTERVDAPGPAPFVIVHRRAQESTVDAIAVMPEPQAHQGKARPSEAAGAAPGKSTMWSFVAARDSFRAERCLTCAAQ